MRGYFLGASVRFWVKFAVDGVATDPSIVELRVRAPDGTLSVHTKDELGSIIEQVETGYFRAVLQLNDSGVWRYRWKGAGQADAVSESFFEVFQSELVSA